MDLGSAAAKGFLQLSSLPRLKGVVQSLDTFKDWRLKGCVQDRSMESPL